MKRGLLLLPVVLVAASCGTGFPNMQRVPVHYGGCGALVVVRQDSQHLLGYTDDEGRLTIITSALDGFGEITSILPSPSRERILIESYGEGHQFICIYDIHTLLDRRSDAPMIPADTTLDPYPYSLTALAWADDKTIRFESEADYRFFDKESRRGKYLPEQEVEIPRTWKWSILTDHFEEVGSQKAPAH